MSHEGMEFDGNGLTMDLTVIGNTLIEGIEAIA